MFIESGYIDNSSIIFEDYEYTNRDNDNSIELLELNYMVQRIRELLNKGFMVC